MGTHPRWERREVDDGSARYRAVQARLEGTLGPWAGRVAEGRRGNEEAFECGFPIVFWEDRISNIISNCLQINLHYK